VASTNRKGEKQRGKKRDERKTSPRIEQGRNADGFVFYPWACSASVGFSDLPVVSFRAFVIHSCLGVLDWRSLAGGLGWRVGSRLVGSYGTLRLMDSLRAGGSEPATFARANRQHFETLSDGYSKMSGTCFRSAMTEVPLQTQITKTTPSNDFPP
jgi:hypothetical protein